MYKRTTIRNGILGFGLLALVLGVVALIACIVYSARFLGIGMKQSAGLSNRRPE